LIINALYRAEVIHRRGPWRNVGTSNSLPWNGSIDSKIRRLLVSSGDIALPEFAADALSTATEFGRSG
jgi:hypothetical protein